MENYYDEFIILERKLVDFNNVVEEFRVQNSVDRIIFKEKLYDILGFIEICLKYTIVLPEDKPIVSAFKYANNIKKHSRSLFCFSIFTPALYPSDNLYPSDDLFPSSFKIWWNEVPLDKIDFKKQYDCYNSELLHKDIPESINNICEIIKNGIPKGG